jgi:hypothetical protein
MKKFFLYFSVVAVLAAMMTSCANVKRDCQGNKKYKHPGGFYM